MSLQGHEADGDPIDYPCDDCGAEVGERCRPTCTALETMSADNE